MKIPVSKRVAKGASLLDRKMPGWERQVDLASLEIASCCRCMLGQLYEQFELGDERLFDKESRQRVTVNGTPAYRHGFDATSDKKIDDRPLSPQYADLDEACISLVKERFDSGILSDSV